MRDLEGRIGRYIVRLGDSLMLVLALLAALGVHSWLQTLLPGLRALAPTRDFLITFVLVIPSWNVALSFTAGDRIFTEGGASRSKVVGNVVSTQLVSLVITLALLWFGQVIVNRSVILLYLSTQFVLVLAVRLAIVQWRTYRRERGLGGNKVLIFGDEGSKYVQHLRESSSLPSLVPPPPEGGLTGVDLLEDLLHENQVDQVVFTPPYTSINDARDLIERCEERGVPYVFVLPEDESGEREPRIVMVGDRPVVTYVRHESRPFSLAIKQVADTVGSLLGVIVTSPLLLGVALALWISDGRPVLFSQERIGLNGRRFRMLKFRTMVKDAEKLKVQLTDRNEAGGPVFKLTGDPRITPLGHFLRRSSIDELPQLLNVLAGDMSLIGPRPLPSSEQQQIRGAMRRRLAMKPGITGLWQVSGRSDITFDQWMALDLKYVDEWSLWLDVKILLKTIPTVLLGSGAR